MTDVSRVRQLRSLRYVVLPDPSLQQSSSLTPGSAPQAVTHAQRNKRIQFLFGIAAAQSLSMWVLARV